MSRVPKQEQEQATTDVVEVAPGVLRLQLPINFTGLGHVNMYALVDGDGIAVVDPGLPGGGTWDAIVDRLGRAGFEPRHVHTVIVTHSHPDHFGGAGRLAHEAGARLVAHAGFRVPWLPETWPDVIELDDDGFPLGVPEPDGSTHGGHVHHGGEPAVRWRGRTKWDAHKSFMPPVPVRLGLRAARRLRPKAFRSPIPTVRLADGEDIVLAGRRWQAVHTPGHTEDHLCLHDPDEGVLLTGDHVLPTITPHISGMGSTPAHDPLDAFLVALERVASLPTSIALPAHGHPFTDVAGRVEAINRHHDARLAGIGEIADELGGRGTVEAFSQRLFRKSHWGLMAESETFAHLEHLRHTGRATVATEDGRLVYALEDTTPLTDEERLAARELRARRESR